MSAERKDYDVVVLGAGMAGASLAAELGETLRVAIVEVDDQPGRHATGRSAALFVDTYGDATIRALTRASRSFFDSAPAGFAQGPLITPRGSLVIAGIDRVEKLDEVQAMSNTKVLRLDAGAARRLVPILRPEWLGGAVFNDAAFDIDVAAMLQGYLRVARRKGVEIILDAGDVRVERSGRTWTIHAQKRVLEAATVVNACGAWADVVASQAGVRPVGLQPLRRSAALIPNPGADIAAWPAVIDTDETFYFKPDAGQLLISPANEDPSPPCDAAADEMEIAIAVDRFERATTVSVRRVTHRWAGLRSFVADRVPVVGFDADAAGFFWLAGQGGSGIQTAPALARTAAAFILGRAVPDDISEQGVAEEALSPLRPALRRPATAVAQTS